MGRSVADKIQDIRVDEVRLLKILAYVVGVAFSIMLGSLPLMLPVIVFSAAATITGTVITASKAFTVIALFNILRFPFAFFPLAAAVGDYCDRPAACPRFSASWRT